MQVGQQDRVFGSHLYDPICTEYIRTMSLIDSKWNLDEKLVEDLS